MSPLLALLALVPAAAAAAAALLGHRRVETTGRIAAGAATINVALALAVLVATLGSGPLSFGALLYANTLSAVLIVLVTSVGAIVQVFGRRYLRAEAVQPRFYAASGVLLAATIAMVAAGTLVGLTAAWILSSIALVALLGMYAGVPGARDGVRRTAAAFLVADTALVAATVIATSAWGTIRLSELAGRATELAGDEAAVTAVASLLVAAAVGRSAQLPLQGWLPATLAAPTPVSALLHAGVVNAGGVLLIKLSPIFGASAVATHAAFALGAATAIYGTALMLTKTDVKGALTYSTMGQMGFMVMTCGLGAFAAATFHLIAHGLYKATLFLGSGSAIARATRERKAPRAAVLTGGALRRAVAAALLTPALAVGAALAILSPSLSDKPGGVALTLFAWATGAWMMWRWAARSPRLRAITAAGGLLIAATVAYLSAISGFAAVLEPSLAGAGTATVSPWLLLAPMLVMAVTSLALGTGRVAAAQRLTGRLYVAAQGAGHVYGSRAARAGGAGIALNGVPRLTLQPQGGAS